MIINEDFFDSQDITIKDDSDVAVDKNPSDKNSYTHTIAINLRFNNRIDSYKVMQTNKQWEYERVVWIITMFERFIKRCMDVFDDGYLLQYILAFEGDDRTGKKEIMNFFGRDMFVNEDGRRGKPSTLVAIIYFNPGNEHSKIMRWVKRIRDISMFNNILTFSELFLPLSSWRNYMTVFNKIVDYESDDYITLQPKTDEPNLYSYIKHRYFVQTDNKSEIDARYNLDQDIATLYNFLHAMFGITYDEVIRYFFKKECPGGNDFPRITESYRFMTQYTFLDIRHQKMKHTVHDMLTEGVFVRLFAFPEQTHSITTRMFVYQIDIDDDTERFVKACEPDSDFLISVLIDKPCEHITLLAHKTGSAKLTDVEYNLTYLSEELDYDKDTFKDKDNFTEWISKDAKIERIVNYIGTGDASDSSGVENAYNILKKVIL